MNEQTHFTLETLRAINFCTGQIAEYTYTTPDGQTVTETAGIEDLTAAERTAALIFILRYCRAQSVRKGGHRRPAKPPTDLIKELENYIIDIDALDEAPDYSALFDCTELERILADTADPAEQPATTDPTPKGTTETPKEN